MNTSLKYWAVFAAFAGLLSCNSDDDFSEPEPPSSIAPPSFSEGDQQLSDTLTVGDTVILSPRLQENNGVTYTWTIAEEVVSTDSIYAFGPEERGDYKITFSAQNDGGEISAVYNIYTLGDYENGFYIVNEGWMGHGTRTLSFYRYDTGAVEDSVFVKKNPDKDLLPTTSTLEYGTIFNEELYLVTKVGGPVVVADAYSLREKGRIPARGGNDWRAFTGLDESRGLLSSGDGVYTLSLNPVGLSSKINGIEGQTGDMIKAGNYVFVLSAAEGAVVLNAETLKVEKTIPGIQTGFARTGDGKVWMAGETTLTGVDPETLNMVEVELGFDAYGSWGAWHPGSITASATDVYIAKNSAWSGGSEIYRYTGNAGSLTAPFTTLPEGKVMYGSGLQYDPNTDRVVVHAVDKGWGDSFSRNALYFYNGQTGGLVDEKTYEGYYFPAVSVFHKAG